jgi:hypothetical protein
LHGLLDGGGIDPEVTRLDDVVGAQHDRALHQVAQLANVARPGVLVERALRSGR